MTVARASAAVLGATGYVGSQLVPRLLAEGRRVRAVGRSLDALAREAWPGAELAAADVTDCESLERACRGCDVVYYLVHLMDEGGALVERERGAARNLATAAARAGVRRIVYLGSLAPVDAGSAHVEARLITGETLRAGAVPVTELRAGIVVGPGSAAFEVMRDLVMHLPVMVTPRWVQSTSPPIALENLLEYLVRLAEHPDATGAPIDVAGPERLTYEQMMRTLARLSGRREPWIIPVPVLTPRLSSYWLRLVTSVPTNVARALIDGLGSDFAACDDRARQLVPQRLLSFSDAVRVAFAAERAGERLPHWREGDFHMRGQRHEHAYYAKRAGASLDADVRPEAVWREISSIGGDDGYYYLDWLWRARELIDAAAGGEGGRRHRSRPHGVAVGDRIDTWEVIGVEPGRRLTLRFGMKGPGAGVLEIGVDPVGPRQARVFATAYWHPAGALGLLYWYALAPAHAVIFTGLTRAIVQRARARY
ncbi:MAG: DUF2867 domain-containing protein [Proteobacteria bacterium]|nr:DUF2867 domain-containing protein [Pseudomonadota bacterium]